MLRDRLGRLGEDVAARFLEMRDTRILARRYRHAGREIDIVAWDGRRVLFVEVKTRRGTRCGTPASAVTHRKRQHIRSAARGYLAEHNAGGAPVRFDVVEITLSGGGLDMKLRYLPGAFRGR